MTLSGRGGADVIIRGGCQVSSLITQTASSANEIMRSMNIKYFKLLVPKGAQGEAMLCVCVRACVILFNYGF